MPELSDDTLETAALGSSARWFGANGTATGDLKSYGRASIYATAVAAMASSPYGARHNLGVGTISVFDYIPEALWAGIRAGTDATDLSSYLADVRTAAAALGYPCTIVWPSGRYTYSVSPNWGISRLRMVTDGYVLLNYTGTGIAFDVDGGGSGIGVISLHFDRFFVKGTSSATHGARFRTVHHSTFEGPIVIGAGTTSYGILIEFCVLSQWNKLTCSNNAVPLTGSFGTAKPAVGLYLGNRSPGEPVSYCLFINPILEGVPIGAAFDGALGNHVIGGTMEGCSNIGLSLTSSATYNAIIRCDYESNTNVDIYCSGTYNRFDGCDSQLQITFDATAVGNTVTGGVHRAVSMLSGATGTLVEGIRYNWAGTGAVISDAGTNTMLGRNWDNGNARWAPTSMPVYTVANLPTGAAGWSAFASNGRKNGEGAGSGTGVQVFHDGTAWRACDTGATVAA